MGTLRTLLAISVVFAHSFGFVFVGGRNAVQLFYMISGFLISFVIVEKKHINPPWIFTLIAICAYIQFI
jgi:peptidoglycan/LPS O-acetylase OafA/YrhL